MRRNLQVERRLRHGEKRAGIQGFSRGVQAGSAAARDQNRSEPSEINSRQESQEIDHESALGCFRMKGSASFRVRVQVDLHDNV
jgi:hypothetical protein